MKEIVACVSNDNENINPIETIECIKAAGFSKVFIQWYNRDWKISQEEQLKHIRALGLDVVFAHLGYKDINSIWEDNELGESLVDYYQKDLAAMKKNNINLVIMHLTSYFTAPMYNELGLKRLQKIVDYADNLNIKVAFENTKIKGYLEYVLGNIKNKNVGLCYDIGHDHAHFNDTLDLAKFKDRIIAVHLHDNFGKEDEHLLPFDGTINWRNSIRNLKENGYNGPVTLELIYWHKYTSMSPLAFYKKGYEIGQNIVAMFNSAENKK
ncbi:MAG TPA: sugar phosphate isomerase/epimerase family protein [Bacilli bacterium]|nr:sugar phosphate isomerase/epimerase family protein [Bacilli bacterium]